MSAPRHLRLAEALLAQITRGDYPVGGKLPTEQELCLSHGLARGTVRRALGHLEELGMITRRPGAGTVVVAPAPLPDYRPIAESAGDILMLAHETHLVSPRSREIVTDDVLARRIGTLPGTSWFLLEGVRARRRGNTTPLCWSEHYLRADLPRTGLVRGEFSLEDVSANTIRQTISATLLTEAQADALKGNPGAAALMITRRHYEPEGGDLISVGIHTHPADRYEITTEL